MRKAKEKNKPLLSLAAAGLAALLLFGMATAVLAQGTQGKFVADEWSGIAEADIAEGDSTKDQAENQASTTPTPTPVSTQDESTALSDATPESAESSELTENKETDSDSNAEIPAEVSAFSNDLAVEEVSLYDASGTSAQDAVTSWTELKSAVASAANGATIYLSGEITIPLDEVLSVSKNLRLVGTGSAQYTNTVGVGSETVAQGYTYTQNASLRISANYIELRYLNMELVSEFLDWLETSRHIAVTTRNQRLAAIKAFAHFVQYKFPENIENCVDIINLRPKKYEKALIPFLTEDDLSLLLSQPDASTRQGLRDLTLLALLYDSGARVQELVDLRLKDVRLTHPPMVILTGKGRKVRQVPLMKDTCKLLDRYIRSFHSDSQSQMIPLFYNAKKQALSRYGVTYILKKYAAKASPVLEPQNISPHVLRHTKAMHLLRAGVNMIYIRDFLGHADISTTEVYARIDAEMKRKVFEEKVPNYTPNTTMPWEEDEDLLQWLTQFGKKTF